ncbi:MAG TPA: NADH-quinone oxidoreductase subunit N [Cyclobacteriaceae bacterium]|nr:NADH-quinone oxidoreductase subunit N [Cyclobacteriaceae bacterium]
MNALYIVCGLGLTALVAELFNARKILSFLVIIGLAVAIGLTIPELGTSVSYFTNMVVFDNFAMAFSILIMTVTILRFWMAQDYFNQDLAHYTDRASLILFTVAGGILMASFNNMAILFLGIEILSLSLYTLAGSKRDSLASNEAAFKYFLMGSFATGFLLLGIALVYGATASFNVQTIAATVVINSATLPAFFYVGVLLIMVGLAFKISAVPFHFWAPDVYSGSPTSVTAFMSTVVKVAAIAAFVKVFSVCFGHIAPSWSLVLKIIMILTLAVPNLIAAAQDNVKRMLAYSSVGHVGYILLAFLSQPENSASGIFYYLSAYSVASITSFAVLLQVEKLNSGTDIVQFNGLFKRNPLLAVAITVALLSLAGIPPLAGFFGKYMVFIQAIDKGMISLTILAIVTSLMGAYYYFRVIIAMFLQEPAGGAITVSTSQKILIVVLVAGMFALSMVPDYLLELF